MNRISLRLAGLPSLPPVSAARSMLVACMACGWLLVELYAGLLTLGLCCFWAKDAWTGLALLLFIYLDMSSASRGRADVELKNPLPSEGPARLEKAAGSAGAFLFCFGCWLDRCFKELATRRSFDCERTGPAFRAVQGCKAE